MSPIYKAGFKDLDFLIPSGGAINKIPKITIFVDKIDDVIEMAKYLQSRFFKRIQNESYSENIIHTFPANLTTTSRFKFLANYQTDNTLFWICMEYANMSIKLSDIWRAVQFRISDYITLSELLQQLRRGG